MRASPPIAPEHAGVLYLVLDDLGAKLGRAWRETGEGDADRETLIRDLLDGQFANPAWILAVDADGGWAKDASQDIADELRDRIKSEVPASLQDFLDRYPARRRARQLPLGL